MTKRDFIKHAGLAGMSALAVPHLALSAAGQPSPSFDETISKKPNFLIILTDDQGYGDLGCFGSETIKTPRIDQLAAEGTRFTDFYVQPVCGPSRSALLTGRYPVRSAGWCMPASEITMAETLRSAGYTTGCIGKWDVSNRRPIDGRVPNDQGFDVFWGPLGANDHGNMSIYDNRTFVYKEEDMSKVTKLYTDKSIEFLKANKKKPFLLYLAHTMPHVIIDASEPFKGKSEGGLYGDVIEELDFHTGRLLDALDDLGLRDNTLVIFASDNGPWNNELDAEKREARALEAGSSGPLREGKGSTYEGGLRVPCIVRWPHRVPVGRNSDALFSSIDIAPTLIRLAGCKMPADRIIDGVDQTELLLGESEKGSREKLFYFCRHELQGVRKGKWKLMVAGRENHPKYVQDVGTQGVELYNLETDIGEKSNVAKENPEIVADLLQEIKNFKMPDTIPSFGIHK